MAQYTEWCDELEAALAEPFPDEVHKEREVGGGKKVTYVEWADYVERMNDLVGVRGWESHVDVAAVAGDTVIVKCEISILGNTKSSLGDEVLDAKGYGSVATNAEAQAKKRAFAQHGVGLYLYDKGGGKNPGARTTPKRPAQPSPLPLDGSFVIPKGDHKDKRIDDPSIPMSYLIRTADEMPPKHRSVFETEIKRRMDKAKR